MAQLAAALQQADQQLNELPLETLAAQLTALQAEAAVSEQLRRSQANVVESYRSGLEQMRGQLHSRLDRASRITQERESIGAQLDELRQRETTLHDEIAAFTSQIDPAEAQSARVGDRAEPAGERRTIGAQPPERPGARSTTRPCWTWRGAKKN